jgi:GTP-binding protein HflX
VRERLFHTLDPTTRSFEIAGRSYLLTDTVGFIRKLPHQLVEAFSATLEEALGADLIVHVADASVDEGELHEMLEAVDSVLDETGAGETPRLLALNKVDLLEGDRSGAGQPAPSRTAERRRELTFRFPDAVQVSAETGDGLDALREAIEARFLASLRPMELLVPYGEGGTISELHDVAGELERTDTAEGVRLRARVPVSAAPRFERFSTNGGPAE